MNEEELYNNFHNRVETLTGDMWCPYPSTSFMMAILKTDDKTAIRLINTRRTFTFPIFLRGEPQLDDINESLEL